MIFKYYSQWVFYLFILWLLGYLLKIDTITKYINPYYATLVAAVGYTFWIFYLICLYLNDYMWLIYRTHELWKIIY